jgi:very-short-patch-repair endonuclease
MNILLLCISGNASALRLLTPTTLRWSTLSSPAAERGGLHFFFLFRIDLLPSCMASITELCRELRQRQTQAENILWDNLRNRRLHNRKFLRQYPICAQSLIGRNLYYIPDFYCHEAKLVVEADGPIHNFKKEYDRNRDEVLKLLGLNILRFENDEILNNTQRVLQKIKEHL